MLLPEEVPEHYRKKTARHGGKANRAVGLPTTISPSRNYSRRPREKTVEESEFLSFMGEEGVVSAMISEGQWLQALCIIKTHSYVCLRLVLSNTREVKRS